MTHPDPALRVVLEPTARVRGRWCRFALRFPPEGVVDVMVQVCWADGEHWQRLTAVDRNSFATTIRAGGVPQRVTLLISGSGYLASPLEFAVASPVDGLTWLADVAARARSVLKRRGFGIVRSAAYFAYALTRSETIVLPGSTLSTTELPYDRWIRVFDEMPEQHRRRHEERLQSLRMRPLISCITTLSDLDDIARLVRGMSDQIYPHWELIVGIPKPIADSVSQTLLSKGLDRDAFRLIVTSADRSSTFNALLKEAKGDYLLRLPEGALLRPNALLELVMTAALHPEAELIYSDEDMIDDDGRRRDPSFKPAWSPDFFASRDYVGHLFLLQRATVLALEGWRSGLGNAIDHDLKLRLADRVEPQTIVHLAKVLVSRAADAAQVDPDRSADRERMLREHIARRRLPADVVWPAHAAHPRLRYRVPDPSPLVSVIVPTRDRAELLATCVRSLLSRSLYPSLEVIIVDNGSIEETTHRLFAQLRAERAIRILPNPGPFNYSALNNAAAREANGSILALLNNDIEIIDDDWLNEMVGLAARPQIGCVGAKLLYPDGRVQHAGVYLGVGGLAMHAYRFSAADISGQLNRLSTVQNVSAVTAACLVVRKSVYEEVGGLDDRNLKVAYNDVDFCLKVRRAGYLNVWTPFVQMIHHESLSRGNDTTRAKAKRFADEQSVLRARWGALLFRDPYYSPNLTIEREDFSVRVR